MSKEIVAEADRSFLALLEIKQRSDCSNTLKAFMHERKDEEIAAEVPRGDVEAFRELVERYEPKIGRYAKRFLFQGDDAKDAHDTYY